MDIFLINGLFGIKKPCNTNQIKEEKMSELLKITIKNTGLCEFMLTMNDIHPDNHDVKALKNGSYTECHTIESFSLGLLLEVANSNEDELSSFIKEYNKLAYIADHGKLDDDYEESGNWFSDSINDEVVPQMLKSANLISTENVDFWETAEENYGDAAFESDREEFIDKYPTAKFKIVLKSNEWDRLFDNLSCDSAYSIFL